MKELTINALLFGEGNFFERYEYWRNFRIFDSDSVGDFIRNKDNLETTLSNIIFLSKAEKNWIIFNNVYLQKEGDSVWELGKNGELGYQAKLYKIWDDTGNIFSLWPTKKSKIPHNKPCNEFGETLARDILIYYNSNTKDNFIWNVDYHNNKSEKKPLLKLKFSN